MGENQALYSLIVFKDYLTGRALHLRLRAQIRYRPKLVIGAKIKRHLTFKDKSHI
jgi:hypothetical protein